eukprot:4897957-Prymnesium_polylepis.1
MAAQALGQAAQYLEEQPPAFARYGSVWRKYASTEQLTTFAHAREAVASSLAAAKAAGRPTPELAMAVQQTEAVIEDICIGAQQKAAERPWAELMRGARLAPIGGGGSSSWFGSRQKPSAEVAAEEALQGKLVALYFTASWCGPCRAFSPRLVELYDRA